MIYVDRNTVEVPKELHSDWVQKEKNMLRMFFLQSKRDKKQSAYTFQRRIIQNPEVKRALYDLFNGKCAYCESKLRDIGELTVDTFRPQSGAMNLDGSVSHDHYWWLAYEWKNLYPSCKVCNHSKRTRFPVSGKRIQYDVDISVEKALLIDPCKKDDFKTLHFTYERNGKMYPKTERGNATIEILNLNRTELVAQRKKVIDQITKLLKDITKASLNTRNRYAEEYNELISQSSAYSALAIQYFLNPPEELRAGMNSLVISSIGGLISDTIKDFVFPTIRPRRTKSVDNLASKTSSVKYNMNLDSKADKMAYFSSAKRIQRIEIKNFKIIKSLVLQFPEPNEKEEPWMVLLGENGSGKSTLIQAVALTLAGERKANRLGLNAANFVNRNVKGARKGHVKIHLQGFDDVIELHFNKASDKFTSNYIDQRVILLAFGSTRLMVNNISSVEKDNITTLKNLFDPFAPLPSIERWLGDPKKVPVKQFDKIAIAMKKLLQLPDDRLIYRRKTPKEGYGLYVRINEDTRGIQLKELSAGYQAIFSLAGNIIKELQDTWKDFTIAEGIVVIDEIGTHLHPKWKMQIISALREIFPALNFIVSTHEPLCLRGVNQGEVILMKLDEGNEVIALTELPSPKALTVEQLITSKFFGLITSFDPEVEMQLNQYYRLNAKLARTPEEEVELTRLRIDLERINVLDENEKIQTGQSFLDVGWVNNPVQQDEISQRLKALWTSNDETRSQ